tara:strand:+ start:1030 stop:2016 length:987 start_codon:yes stop_codon:yes gene_type:complete
MAYQSIGVPRFWINEIEWLSIADSGSYLLPSGWNTLPVDASNVFSTTTLTPLALTTGTSTKYPNGNNFLALLGHTCVTDGGNVYIHKGGAEIVTVEIVNKTPHSSGGYDGFSIEIFDNIPDKLIVAYHDDNSNLWIETDIHVGSVVLGSFFDMPNAPNLSLTTSIDYGTTKEFTSYNGSSYSNTFQSSQPKWGSLGAWELANGTEQPQALSRSGRRSWNLKFSFMDDSDLFGSNQMLNNYITGTTDGIDEADINSGVFSFTLLYDDNFFSQVWHKTLGGTIPFIFQPDSSNNNNPDSFFICRFKNSSLKATLTAPKLYDISLDIEECW